MPQARKEVHSLRDALNRCSVYCTLRSKFAYQILLRTYRQWRENRTTQADLAVIFTTPVTQSRKTDPDEYSRVNTPSPWATAEKVGRPRRRSYCACHRQSASTHPDEAPNMDRGPRESKNAATDALERTSPSSTYAYVRTSMRTISFVCVCVWL